MNRNLVKVACLLLFAAIVAGVWPAIIAGRRPPALRTEPQWTFTYSMPAINLNTSVTNRPPKLK